MIYLVECILNCIHAYDVILQLYSTHAFAIRNADSIYTIDFRLNVKYIYIHHIYIFNLILIYMQFYRTLI